MCVKDKTGLAGFFSDLDQPHPLNYRADLPLLATYGSVIRTQWLVIRTISWYCIIEISQA